MNLFKISDIFLGPIGFLGAPENPKPGKDGDITVNASSALKTNLRTLNRNMHIYESSYVANCRCMSLCAAIYCRGTVGRRNPKTETDDPTVQRLNIEID